MNLNDLRIGVTLLSMGAFAGIAAWAWSRRQLARFDEASRLPFVAEAAPAEDDVAAGDRFPHRHGYRAKQLP